MTRYCLPDGYVERLNNTFHDDTTFKDECQREVYEIARQLFYENRLSGVLDLGCGSAYKSRRLFRENTSISMDKCGYVHLLQGLIGVDLKLTVTWLNDQYPEGYWRDWESGPVFVRQGLVICADMIEHVADPDTVLDFIERCHPKLVVLSTPDRSMLPEPGRTKGPPNNGCHVREWSMPEFRMYLERRNKIACVNCDPLHPGKLIRNNEDTFPCAMCDGTGSTATGPTWKILRHEITNQEQCTQMVVCEVEK